MVNMSARYTQTSGATRAMVQSVYALAKVLPYGATGVSDYILQPLAAVQPCIAHTSSEAML